MYITIVKLYEIYYQIIIDTTKKVEKEKKNKDTKEIPFISYTRE